MKFTNVVLAQVYELVALCGISVGVTQWGNPNNSLLPGRVSKDHFALARYSP